MGDTTERFSPDQARTIEERVIAARHLFAYALVRGHARPSDRLLEVGFGEGYGSEIVKPWVAEYVGVEVEGRMVPVADARYGSDGVSFQEYDGTRLPFDDASFDLAIAFQVIEHVADPALFLRELRRVVRSGRPVLVVTPNRLLRLGDDERPWNRFHLREFSPSELEAVVRDVFAHVELFGVVGSDEMNAIEMARLARARRLARLDRFGLRYLLPEGLDTRLRSLLRRSAAEDRPDLDEKQIGVEHLHLSKTGVESALDLLAIAV